MCDPQKIAIQLNVVVRVNKEETFKNLDMGLSVCNEKKKNKCLFDMSRDMRSQPLSIDHS